MFNSINTRIYTKKQLYMPYIGGYNCFWINIFNSRN